ncbi:MAG TPA: S1 RNA-binding domain-containing protein, partial [Marinobacter sp.]|nr:S1 RNA-binding domain-containing protein [Marinobacter sp.]
FSELEKPGRDPRPEFRFASFEEGVETLKDLEPGMVLEGSVTNVTNFGAFVDIGVHQDGLVHISALADRFVKDPREVVKAGDIVKVKVMEVDIPRKRIALTMRLGDQPGPQAAERPRGDKTSTPNRNHAASARKPVPAASQNPAQGQGAMAGALAQAMASANKRDR